ncbi:UNVERIFIED_CONTAM: Gamma-glutamylcyclotransferase 2-3 [Sesamum calycinum]|uniref:glutathione-specific gamma-glutamylcyclotransferase n=1 Tax=Sesamum calycinum TaxID=2727403 RepID=A0AAW2QP21_9LAMI
MAMWVFGYGSLIWKAGFPYDERLVGFIKDYRRVFYQGSTDHRGTPEFPGRTVTLGLQRGKYVINMTLYPHIQEHEMLKDLMEPTASTPAVSNVMVYIASADKKQNQNYLGPASLEDIAVYVFLLFLTYTARNFQANTNEGLIHLLSRFALIDQIVKAEGPSGPNREYLFKLENALIQIGCEDKHVIDLANEVRRILSLQGELTV